MCMHMSCHRMCWMVGMTGSGGGACAVCKHQRRKCEPNCELAAYFPANRMNDFRALHLVFGVANLTKLIKANTTDAGRRRAAETLTWEARWRERDPAEGCYREVACLRRDNALLRAENAALRRAFSGSVVMPPAPSLAAGSCYTPNANEQTIFSYAQDRGLGVPPLCPPANVAKSPPEGTRATPGVASYSIKPSIDERIG